MKNKKQKTKNRETKNLLSVICYLLSDRGFTLVELLVVTVLIGLIGVIITEMFILGFKSHAKSEVVKEVKQNGDYIMSVMEGMVRNALDITQNCNISASTLTLLNQDRLYTTFLCPTGIPQYMASVSSGFPDPAPTVSQPLTSSRVTVSNCTFRVVCPTPPLSPKYVYVSYSISQTSPTGQPTPRPEGRASMKYQATFTLRNYE